MFKHDNDLTLVDWFCGAGGSTQGTATIPGVRPIHAANHWKQAIESHAANFPDVEHWKGDIRDLDVSKLPPSALFWASPECFPAGTLILTGRGNVPIEDVRLTDVVLTHRRRWRHVTAVMTQYADTVVVKGVGVGKGIEVTAEHPFYASTMSRAWDVAQDRYRTDLTVPSWTPAKDMGDRQAWATPVDFTATDGQPAVPLLQKVEMDSAFWWMVGRWLGDGSLRLQPKTAGALAPRARLASRPAGSPCVVCGQTARPARTGQRLSPDLASPYCSDRCQAKNARVGGKGRYELTIVCGFHEAQDLQQRLAQVRGLTWTKRDLRTAAAFTAAGRDLVQWLSANFGQHANGKTIPAWALGMAADDRQSLLDGYTSADGHRSATGWQTTSVSKALALGVRMLANSLGAPANLSGPYTRRPHQIEGRDVTALPYWTVQWSTDGHYRRTFSSDRDGLRWLPVREVTDGRRDVQVFNLSVDDDESYVADGVVVHNCTNWSKAKGVDQTSYRVDKQGFLFDGLDDGPGGAEEADRSRALMEEVPMYLRAMSLRGHPVLAGVVENVVDVRDWVDWGRWRAEIEGVGYRTRLVALNSMHAQSRRTPRAPQSRDRLYLAYWHVSLGRDPDWDKWLRPAAWCPTCEQTVNAMQVWKKPGQDMGRYRQQYTYRCPNIKCRNMVVEPAYAPASSVIDWSIRGERIGDRTGRPLAEKTIRRIEAGIRKFARPVVVEAGGHQYDAADPKHPQHGQDGAYMRSWPVEGPLRTLHTSMTKGIAVPPMLVPVEGREGKVAWDATRPMRTQSTRSETALVVAPFIAELRGGGSTARLASEAMATVTASGNHHGLVVAPDGTLRFGWDEWAALYRYDAPLLRALTDPLPTQTTIQGDALLTGAGLPAAEDCMFRMLEPHEIGKGMAFFDDYIVLGNRRERVRQFGNAVTPPAAEVLMSALVECITGEDVAA